MSRYQGAHDRHLWQHQGLQLPIVLAGSAQHCGGLPVLMSSELCMAPRAEQVHHGALLSSCWPSQDHSMLVLTKTQEHGWCAALASHLRDLVAILQCNDCG